MHLSETSIPKDGGMLHWLVPFSVSWWRCLKERLAEIWDHAKEIAQNWNMSVKFHVRALLRILTQIPVANNLCSHYALLILNTTYTVTKRLLLEFWYTDRTRDELTRRQLRYEGIQMMSWKQSVATWVPMKEWEKSEEKMNAKVHV